MNGDGLSPKDRRALTSVAAQFFVNGMLFASFIPRLPEIRDRIEIDSGELGRILAVGAVSGVIGSLVVGRLIERFGTRRLLVSAGICLCASLTVIGVATVPAVLMIGLALMSIFDVLVDSAMNLQGSWISGRRRAPVMNRLHGLWSLGTVVGGVGAAQLAGLGVSLQTHLFAVAVMLLVVVLLVGRGLLHDDEHPVDLDATTMSVPMAPTASTATSVPMAPTASTATPAASAPMVAGERGRGSLGPPVRWWRGPMAVLAIVGACSIAMELTSSDWAAFRLSDDFSASPGVAGLGYVAFTAGMTTGRFGGDSMIVRFGQRRVADVGIAMTIIGLSTSSFVPNQGLVMAGYLAAGLGVATQFPKLYDDAAKHPGRPGAGLGALTGGSRIALLVTPLAVGSLAASQLSVGAATAIVTLPAAFAFLLVLRRSSPAPARQR